MAKLSFATGPKDKKRGNVQDKKISEEEVEKIKQKLRPGESFRKSDQLYSYRPTKKDYDGPEKVNQIYAPTLEELRQKEIELLSRLNSQLSVADKKRSLNDEYRLWKNLKTGIRDSTMSNYVYMYEHYVLPSKLGKNYLRLITKSDVKSFYLWLLDTRQLKISTLDNIQGVIYQVLEMAREDRIIIGNPADGALTEIRKAYENDNERIALTVGEQDGFLRALDSQDNPSWKDLFTVLLLTGMRAGELCGLQWSDVDFEENVIHVRNNLVYYAHVSGDGHSGYNMHTPKSKAGTREIPMFPLVKDCLLRAKKMQDDTNVHCAKRIDGYDDFCFLNRFNLPFHHSTLNAALKRIVLRYNDLVLADDKCTNGVLVPVFSCHVLRHTCATRLIENNCNPLAVMSMLGHKSLKVTLEIYVTVTENFKKQELGVKSKIKKEYPDIFKEQLKREERSDNMPQASASQYLPICKPDEIDFITQIYTEFTQNDVQEKTGYKNL